MKFLIAIVFLLLGGILASHGWAQNSTHSSASPPKPLETGRVEWSRDLEAAWAHSRSDARPVLVLFQEIPG